MSNNLAGMTVNERLGELQLFGEWDEAVIARDRRHMIEVMLKVDLSEDEAARTVDTVLNDPKSYGF